MNTGGDGRDRGDKRAEPALQMQVALKLKAARQQRRLSLRALGEQVGFSASFLSQVELGQVSPSLGSLERIAQALGLHLSELLSEPAPAPGPMLHRRQHASLHSEWSRATVESLLPAGVHQDIGVVLISLEPGGRSGKWSSLSNTGKELAFCVRGKATITMEEARYDLSGGDSLFYDSARTSRWENTGKSRAEILLVSFRSLRRP